MTSPDDKGQVSIPADIEGQTVKIRFDGAYLTEALKACGGMVDLKLTDSQSPALFAVDGFQLVVMPMFSGNKPDKTDTAEASTPETETGEAEAQAVEQTAEVEVDKAEAVAEAEAIAKSKPKRSRKRDKVAVA
ncbi:hypothetical protein ACFLXC_04595, partial [Chloroflexota bacterium]